MVVPKARKLVRFYCFSSIVLFIVLVFAWIRPVSVFTQIPETLIISEINPFGSINDSNCKSLPIEVSRCSFDKWIEIYNPTHVPINLNGWSLRFKNSDTKLNNLVFTQNIIIQPQDYFLIGYKEINYYSTVASANIHFGGITGKVRNLSSRETGKIQVSLVNPKSQNVFEVNLNLQDFPQLQDSLNKLKTKSQNTAQESGDIYEEKRYSLEYVSGRWVPSSNEFYPNNFGTPRNTVGYNIDLDSQKIEDIMVIDESVNSTQLPQTLSANPISEISSEVVMVQGTESPAIQAVPDQNLATQHPSELSPVSNTPAPLIVKTPSIVLDMGNQFSRNTQTILKDTESIVAQDVGNSTTSPSHIISLIEKQMSIFKPKQVVLSFSVDFEHSKKISALNEKQLWEYFFSYQVMGILVIFLAMGLAISQKNNLFFEMRMAYKPIPCF